MIVAIDINETREFTLKADTEDPTVFTIGQLDPTLRAVIEDEAAVFGYAARDGSGSASSSDVKLKNRQRELELVRYGLRNWRNFKNGKGQDVGFFLTDHNVAGAGKRRGVSDESLAMLPIDAISEIAAAVRAFNTIDKDTEKNSVAPSK